MIDVKDKPVKKQIILSEYEKSNEYYLEDEVFRLLKDNFSNYIDIFYSPKRNYYRIRAKNFTGIINVGDLIINIKPKIGLNNLFFLINYCYKLPFRFDEEAPMEQSYEIFNYYIYLFANATKEIIRKGVYRRYLDKVENTIYLKGRLLIEQNIRNTIVDKTKNVCKFDEYTENVLENHILKYITKKLIRIVDNKEIKNTLRYNLLYLNAIDRSIKVTNNDFDKIIYTRLNKNYEYPLNLAKFFINNIFIKDILGSKRVSSFLVDMNKLFESFVFMALQEKLESSIYKVVYQKSLFLDDSRKIKIFPDILIQKKGKASIVIDVKYKIENNYINSDIYQLIAYCKRMNIRNGIIVLPIYDEFLSLDNLSFFNGNIKLNYFYLGLEKERIKNKTVVDELYTFIAKN